MSETRHIDTHQKMGTRYLFRRFIMNVAGVLILGISIGVFLHCSFGVDPYSVFLQGLLLLVPFKYGLLYIIVNAVIIVVVLCIDKKGIGIGTFLNLLTLGYVIQYTQAFCQYILPDPALWVRIILFVISFPIYCLGAAFSFSSNLGVSTYDAISVTASKVQSRLSFRACRIIIDCSFVVIGVFFILISGGSVSDCFELAGVGTIVCASFTGTLIVFFSQRVAMPLLDRKQK